MSEKLKIFKSLNIEANEVAPVLLLIAQSVFLGIFYGTFDIGAHTLFLKTYPEDMIPKAYIVSGLLGIVLTSIFSKFQSKIKFSKLANSTLLFISLITVLLRIFFEITDANWAVFLVFILLGPLNILAILAFWGTVGRIFNLRQGKRLYGIIDSGQVFGIIISSYAIPVILIHLHGTKNLLVISAISIIGALLFEAIILRKFKIDNINKDDQESEKDKNQEQQVKLKDFIKDPYITYMALFVIFSMFAAFFVQYSFLVVTNEKYPLEEDLAKYLGFFTGSMMIFTFIIKTFVYSKLMKTYGLKVSLMLSSLLLIVFTGIAIIIGYISGFDTVAPGFIYFFLFISMGKLFNKTLKDALEVPAFKLLYQSLKKSIRFDIQAKIDGTINEIAALISGILLSILGILSFIKLIHFSVFLFALLIIWFVITLRLHKEYRNSLEKALKQNISGDDASIENSIIQSFKNLIGTPQRLLTKLTHLRNYAPYDYLKTLQILIGHFSPEQLNFLSREHIIEVLLLNSQKATPDNWNILINKQYKTKPIKNATVKELSTYLNSDNLTDVNSAIAYLNKLNKKDRLTLLSSLLRAPNTKTQITSIRICGTMGELELINTLVEFLDSQYLLPSALNSLQQMGKKSVKHLIQMFYKTDISLIAQLALIDTIGRYNTNESIVFLLNNISHHRKEIKEKTISSLKHLDYQPTEKELPKMFHSITEAAQTLAWDYSALASLSSSHNKHPIKKAITYEFNHHQKTLLDLLSITYDTTSVQHVQDYLESDTAEGISYALELFDLFLSEEIKPMIITIFDDIPVNEKTRLFEEFFPVSATSDKELLLNIINRDPNLISIETKKTALVEYTKLFDEITNDIVAQLFNPVPKLQLAAAIAANQIQPTKLKQLKPRMTLALLKNLKHIDKNTPVLPSLFSIDEILLKHLKIDNNSVTELSEYIEIKQSVNSQFFNNTDEIKKYFVFLVANQNELSKTYDTNLLIEGDINFESNSSTNYEYFIGISKNSMSKLFLTKNKIIRDLINSIL